MKRRGLIFHACCVLLCATGCNRRDSREMREARPAAALDRTTVLATVPELAAKPPGVPMVLGLHNMPAESGPEFVFSARGGGVAFVVEDDDGFRVVHNGSTGKRYAAVGEIALSADGRRCAYGALVGGKWHMVVDGKEGEGFGTVKSPVFSADGSRVAYQAMAGERWHLVVGSTVNAGTRTRYLKHAFSSDASRIAFVGDLDDQGLGRLVVSDSTFEKETVVGERVSGMLSNAGGSRVAAIGAYDGRGRVLSVRFDRPDRVEEGALYDGVDSLAFGPDGVSLAYLGERSGRTFVVMGDREEPLPLGAMVLGSLVIRPDGKGVGALVAVAAGAVMREFFTRAGDPGKAYAVAEGLVYSDDGRSHAFAASRGASWFVVVDGKEGPEFDRVVTPAFSPGGREVVYRARRDGKRFVVVADLDGKTIREHSAHEQVFPVLFTTDGRSVAYGIKEGRQLIWKAEAL